MAEKKVKATTEVKKAAAPKKAAAKKTSNLTQMKATPEQIAALAHRYWAERGHTHGHDLEDWCRAEQELIGKAS